MDTLGERIKRLRQEKGISQRQFAKMVGTSPGLISFIERNRNKPNFEIIGRMATVLDISTDYLIMGKANTPEPTEEIITRLKKEIIEESGSDGGLRVTAKEKELIKRYNILSRLARLSRTDFEVMLEILARIEQSG